MAKLKFKNLKERVCAAFAVLKSEKFIVVSFCEKPEQEHFSSTVWDSGNLDIFFKSAVIFSAQFYISKKYKKLQEKILLKRTDEIFECAKKEFQNA
ncbi:MAG: hypothetical protein K1X86_15595 [Ignavibacteria bacterium]|nr:hypothetical protein [Ignavibacteria bacterium]